MSEYDCVRQQAHQRGYRFSYRDEVVKIWDTVHTGTLRSARMFLSKIEPKPRPVARAEIPVEPIWNARMPPQLFGRVA
jgi:hypothetical protein